MKKPDTILTNGFIHVEVKPNPPDKSANTIVKFLECDQMNDIVICKNIRSAEQAVQLGIRKVIWVDKTTDIIYNTCKQL